MNHELTNEQTAILKAVRETNTNLLIDAKAGTGKTSTILESLGNLSMRNRSALLCAFNKRIADELMARLPTLPRTHAAHIKTFHALGLRVLKRHYPHLEVDSSATENLVNAVMPEKANFWVRRSVNRLVRALKETTYVAANELELATVIDCGHRFNCFDKIGGHQIDDAAGFAMDVYEAGADIKKLSTIDFCDMVWLPTTLNLEPPSRYQVVFVDELQDISMPQFCLIQMHMVKGGRIIGVGDQSQSIYAWRGAEGTRAWRTMKNEYKAQTLPLTITFRCSKAVVAEANRLVPELRAREDAPNGIVDEVGWDDLPTFAATAVIPSPPDLNTGELRQPSAYVLSRNNADLLQAVLFLWKRRVRFTLNAGDEFLEPLLTILNKLDLGPNFQASLLSWYLTEHQRAESTGSVAYADKIEEQFSMLTVAARYTDPRKIADLLTSITRDKGAAITCSTVHKVKGLEADVVFLLKQTFAAHDHQEWMTEPIDQEELNIEYVAITRARHLLYWVNMSGSNYIALDTPKSEPTATPEEEAVWMHDRQPEQRVKRGDDGLRVYSLEAPGGRDSSDPDLNVLGDIEHQLVDELGDHLGDPTKHHPEATLADLYPEKAFPVGEVKSVERRVTKHLAKPIIIRKL